jgi:hypothetical protein
MTGFGGDRGGFVEESIVVLPEKTGTSVALAWGEGRLHLAWTGNDSRLNLMSSRDGYHFEHKQTFPHRSSRIESGRGKDDMMTTVPLAPSLAAAHDGLHLAWTGTDGRPNVWGPHLGAAGHTVLPERSSQPPALGVWRRDLALAWTGTDGHLNLEYSSDGSFATPFRMEETSHFGPAVCGVGPDVAVAWTGTDRRLNVLSSKGGRFGAPVRLDQKSVDAPSLCAPGNDVVLAWTGARRVNLLVLRKGEVGAHVVSDARSDHRPSICAAFDGVAVAWTGTDGRVNVARLRRTG